jgi:hypothetical protein
METELPEGIGAQEQHRRGRAEGGVQPSGQGAGGENGPEQRI